jgi:carbohydrate kinase (thermoresistant glucokinase family)
MTDLKCKVIVLMGVTGSGKSTIGELLSRQLAWDYYDADDFHPPANVKKMANGIPLEDEDRWPWLEGLAAEIDTWLQGERGAILACSALKESYRNLLVGGRAQICLVHLKGHKALIAGRLAERVDHYMPASLLDSQFQTLEEPQDALVVNIDATPEEIAADIQLRLEL